MWMEPPGLHSKLYAQKVTEHKICLLGLSDTQNLLLSQRGPFVLMSVLSPMRLEHGTEVWEMSVTPDVMVLSLARRLWWLESRMARLWRA